MLCNVFVIPRVLWKLCVHVLWMQKLLKLTTQAKSGFRISPEVDFMHRSHWFCFESDSFLGNETLAHFWISFWIAPSPIPQHLCNETDCSLNPWGVAAFGGEMGKKIKGVVHRLHVPKHLTWAHPRNLHSVFSHTANLALLLSLKAIKWQMFRFYPR